MWYRCQDIQDNLAPKVSISAVLYKIDQGQIQLVLCAYQTPSGVHFVYTYRCQQLKVIKCTVVVVYIHIHFARLIYSWISGSEQGKFIICTFPAPILGHIK